VPEFVLDLGDRGLYLGTFRLPGNISGLELEREWAQLATLRDGLVAHEQYFFGWDKGLRAAGLDPDAIALPSPERRSKQPAAPGKARSIRGALSVTCPLLQIAPSGSATRRPRLLRVPCV
jgi:hypothetical protein